MDARARGLLFFAYGGQKTLNHFLKEAANAARSFREHNPSIRIAVVTNNATVDGRIFDVHISPREDLMFAGENLRKPADRVMRQWLTRLYYLAHSPFKVTWALDSNVLSCTPGAAQAFLDAALATDLWGFHIAHGSQNIASPTMTPHNWNLAFRDAMVVGLMREWFSLQVQQGVASDDQSTLHVAELYFRKAYGKRGFRVGQIAPSFGTAWQNVVQTETHHVKITNRLDGPVHVIHSTNASQCEAANLLGRTVRQVVATRVEDDVRPRRFRLVVAADQAWDAAGDARPLPQGPALPASPTTAAWAAPTIPGPQPAPPPRLGSASRVASSKARTRRAAAASTISRAPRSPSFPSGGLLHHGLPQAVHRPGGRRRDAPTGRRSGSPSSDSTPSPTRRRAWRRRRRRVGARDAATRRAALDDSVPHAIWQERRPCRLRRHRARRRLHAAPPPRRRAAAPPRCSPRASRCARRSPTRRRTTTS